MINANEDIADIKDAILISSNEYFKSINTLIQIDIKENQKTKYLICIRRHPKTLSVIAHDALCPHLGYNLNYANMKDNYIVCQGHGLEFKTHNCKDKEKSGNYCLRFYSVIEKDNSLF